jgi:hypothetical protein
MGENMMSRTTKLETKRKELADKSVERAVENVFGKVWGKLQRMDKLVDVRDFKKTGPTNDFSKAVQQSHHDSDSDNFARKCPRCDVWWAFRGKWMNDTVVTGREIREVEGRIREMKNGVMVELPIVFIIEVAVRYHVGCGGKMYSEGISIGTRKVA